MPGPWDKYKESVTAPGPWDKYTQQQSPDFTGMDTMPAHRTGQTLPITKGKKVKDYLVGPTEPATSVKDFALRVAPESVRKLIPRVAYSAYEAVKGQTDPIVESLSTLQPTGLRRKMEGNAANTLSGLAQGMTAPTGLMGYDAFKQAWASDPAGSALAVAPTLKMLGKVPKAVKSIGDIPMSQLDSVVSKQYQKAVRPSVSGTAGNYKQFTGANKKAAEGVYDIVKAKDRGELALGDEMAGQTPVNRLPETIQEHLQAISQSKSNTFQKYDAMKSAAGEAGAKVDLKPIANELYKASGDPVLNDLRPETARYMKQQAAILQKRDTYTAGQAQQAIATLNKDLESFYRNPSPDMAGKIIVDASVAKHMRKSLDSAIEQEAGPGYQDLKNEYGRLTAMEKEAGHRARVAGRAAPASLIDAIGGYMGAGELVAGILSMNPVQVAKGGTALALKSLIKKINSPDGQIKRMYKVADKNYVRPKEVAWTPPEKQPQRIPGYPGAGKINTLNLPRGDKGAGINTRPGTVNVSNLPVGDKGSASNTRTRIPLNLPVGEPSIYDSTIGRNIPVQQGQSLRSLGNIPIAEETYFDPTVGARIRRKQ